MFVPAQRQQLRNTRTHHSCTMLFCFYLEEAPSVSIMYSWRYIAAYFVARRSFCKSAWIVLLFPCFFSGYCVEKRNIGRTFALYSVFSTGTDKVSKRQLPLLANRSGLGDLANLGWFSLFCPFLADRDSGSIESRRVARMLKCVEEWLICF